MDITNHCDGHHTWTNSDENCAVHHKSCDVDHAFYLDRGTTGSLGSHFTVIDSEPGFRFQANSDAVVTIGRICRIGTPLLFTEITNGHA